MKKIIILISLFFLQGLLSVNAQTGQGASKTFSKNNNQGLDKIKSECAFTDSIQSKEIARLISNGIPKIIEKPNGEYSELIGINCFGDPLYLTAHNQNVNQSIKAFVLNGAGTNWDKLGPFNGENMTIGLWENGRPRPFHELFRIKPGNSYISRIEFVSNPPQNGTITRHSTHVAGTLIGHQVDPSEGTVKLNNIVNGIADKSSLKVWDWLNSTTELATAAEEGILIGNTSFGFNPIYLHPSEFGRYNQLSKEWDEVMCNAPYFQIIKSVGNARDDKESDGNPQYSQVFAKGGYDLLEGAGVSKNVIVVGSVNLFNADSIIADPPYIASEIDEPYSSWGCTDDGRVKPDFVLQGNSVVSASDQSNSAYSTLTGTSMAAAGLSGGAILLQEYWQKKFAGDYMKSATLRAILVHSVNDILNPNTQNPIKNVSDGPDYSYGWGVPDIYKAAQLIRLRGETTIIKEEVLTEDKPFVLNVVANGSEPLVVTLAWTDPAGEFIPINIQNPESSLDEESRKLINDLDIHLVKYDQQNAGQEINSGLLFPWKLLDDGIKGKPAEIIGLPATRGINSVDNVEKIEVPMQEFIDDPAAVAKRGGIYKIVITHKGTLVNSCTYKGQPFSLVVSGVSMCFHDIALFQHEDDILSGEVLVKAEKIQASNVIGKSEDTVEFSAFDQINLISQVRTGSNGSEGFTVDGGANFLAHIDCQTNLSRDAFSSGDLDNALNDTIISPEYMKSNEDLIIFPNPLFNDILNLQFTIAKRSDLKIEVYDINGRMIRQKMSSEIYDVGTHKVTLDLFELPSGTYFIKSVFEDRTFTSKLIIN